MLQIFTEMLFLLICNILLCKIKSVLNENTETYYAFIANQYKDQAKSEFVAICIWYIHQGIIKRAVGFVAT